MPRKVFVANEILTAGAVNTNLMDQAVMVFADAAARTAALGSPSEGMVTYLEDTDSLELYTTVWGPVSPAITPGDLPAGSVLQVKSALFAGTQTASVTAGSNVAVTDLSITHEVASAGNELIITVMIGVLGTNARSAETGIAVHDGTELIGVGDAAGNRTRVSAGGANDPAANSDRPSSSLCVTFVHTPGAGSKTYTVRAVNHRTTTQTLYINRAEGDSDTAIYPRGISSIVIQEVAR